MDQIYADIAARTGGNIYVGVVGPVRTGKSTLIKRIMEELVIPGISDPYRKERARDELPQSGSGKTIMTSEPKFVPEEAVEISPDGKSRLSVRLIDTVGYMVDGAMGAEEDGAPRMVTTPWFEEPIPMTQAAELGTKKVMEERGEKINYLVGTMIEVPRAAITASEIAKAAQFFSFGTNDLTQMTFGFSRDDAGKFLGAYYDKKIYESDPFARLDQVGVGKLVAMAAKLGRESNPDIHLGICGEHGGDPASVEFCHKVGLDYVSCSPFRVPIARLAAAQAAIKEM